jgi:hypothetical protein
VAIVDHVSRRRGVSATRCDRRRRTARCAGVFRHEHRHIDARAIEEGRRSSDVEVLVLRIHGHSIYDENIMAQGMAARHARRDVRRVRRGEGWLPPLRPCYCLDVAWCVHGLSL